MCVGAGQEGEREVLIEQLSWVRSIAQQIHQKLPRSVPLDDLVSAGTLGLIGAIRTFDAARQVEFRCYARIRVRGAILDSLRDSDWSPRILRRKARQLGRATHELSVGLGRCPSETELADKLAMTLGEFHTLKRDLACLEISSLDASPDDVQAPLAERVVGHQEDNPFLQCLRDEMRNFLNSAIAGLPDSARDVLMHYYFDEMTMKEWENYLA